MKMNKKDGILTKLCCACKNCIASCPTAAIYLEENSLGSQYAVVDSEKCIGCGICNTVCPIISPAEKKMPIQSYACISKDKKSIHSSSGAIFPQIAYEILRRGGYVFGAAYNDDFSVCHCAVSDKADLTKLQGSKYVKSDVADSFEKAIDYLKKEKWVLYSGTPCQIAALNKFIKNEVSTDKLITVDIICHGTPYSKLFTDYIAFLEKSKGGKITSFNFRSKKFGSKHVGEYILEKKNKSKKYMLYSDESSYYSFFLKGYIYNNSCYECPYASGDRSGDITLGDFWGIRYEMPQFFKNNNLSETESISAVMVNTNKGMELFNHIKADFICESVAYNKISRNNPRLNSPLVCNKEKREEILRRYKNDGYNGVEEYFKDISDYRRYKLRVICHIPNGLKRSIKKIVSKKRSD